MKKLASLLIFSAAMTALASAPAPTADSIIKDALAQAKNGKRGVIVMFHASWCGWCHRLDKTLEKPEVAKALEKRFVIVHLDGLEQPDKKELENAGWEKYAKQWGADDQGLPFIVALNGKGVKVGDSKVADAKTGKVGNFGFPTEPHEYARLAEIMKMANAKFTPAETAVLLDALKADRPKQ